MGSSTLRREVGFIQERKQLSVIGDLSELKRFARAVPSTTPSASHSGSHSGNSTGSDTPVNSTEGWGWQDGEQGLKIAQALVECQKLISISPNALYSVGYGFALQNCVNHQYRLLKELAPELRMSFLIITLSIMGQKFLCNAYAL